MIEDQDTPAPAAEPASSAPTSDAPAADLDLDALIAEYTDQAGSATHGEQVAQSQQPPVRDFGAELRDSMQSNRDLLEMRLWAEDVQSERLARREAEDAQAIFAEAANRVQDIEHLPSDFAERWLRAEYSLDPELRSAWDNRHASEDALRRCTATLRRTFCKMRGAAKAMPDPTATADRAAVVEAMTRGRSSGPIEKPAPDLSRMSDQEFAKYKEEIGL